MKFYLASLFPEVFDQLLSSSMLLKAKKLGVFDYQFINIRDFGLGPRKQVDDVPYGGGDGMVLKPEPIITLIHQIKTLEPKLSVILPSPRGKTYLQSEAIRLSQSKTNYLIICPKYEGYDERITHYVDEVFSIGNYILTGGEIPAMIIVDSVIRLLPGVLGGESSSLDESFQLDDKTKEYPQYTRPTEYDGLKVPDVLLSGDHQAINHWRNQHKIS